MSGVRILAAKVMLQRVLHALSNEYSLPKSCLYDLRVKLKLPAIMNPKHNSLAQGTSISNTVTPAHYSSRPFYNKRVDCISFPLALQKTINAFFF